MRAPPTTDWIGRACVQPGTGRTEADATELAELCSGHSLRAGFCTASAIVGILEWKGAPPQPPRLSRATCVRPRSGRTAA
jgi:hypothetical protein